MSEEQKYNERREQKDKEIQELKQQLAEKTLTIEQINKAFIENRSLWKGKYEQSNQDKISFAIAELEKVKSAFGLINSKLDKVETIKEYIHYIDHQINGLKGKVE